MKERLRKIAKWVLYPLFYLFCLALFGYLTFPFNRLKDRLIAEFEHAQTKRGQAASGQRLEIDDLSSYWFTGLEASGVRLVIPPDDPSKSGFDGSSMAKATLATMGSPTDAPRDSVVTIDEAHARLRVLPLLLGRVKLSVWASAFGGTISGVVPVGATSGPVELEMADLDLGKVDPLVQLIGLPLSGTASGNLSLAASEGKFNKANGSFELNVTGASVGDGKTKWKGQLALPQAKLGEITITAEATAGVLKITKLASTGPDVELVGEGKVQVREPWNDSTMDLYIRFKFSDAYRDKNDDTRSLLGSPGSSMPALIEIAEPKLKRAKRADGFYGFHVHGTLKRPRFDPSSSDAPASSSKPARGKTGDSPFGTSKKSSGPSFPLGTSQAQKDDVAIEAPPAPPSPAPEPTPERRAATPEPAAPAPESTRPGRDEVVPPVVTAQPPDDSAPGPGQGREPPADR